MPILTICNHKGGTGKTTSAVHLAAAFGRSGRRVLAIDFDPQGFMSRTMGASPPPVEASSLALLDPEADVDAIPVQSMSDFDLIGSTMALTKAQRHLTKPTDVLWLRETLRTIAPERYDIILLDTAAAVSVFTMNALVAADHVVVPVTPEYQPVVGAEQTWRTVDLVRSKLNPALGPASFLLTRVDGRLNRHAAYSRYLRERYGDAVLDAEIRTSSSLAVAGRDGRTVFDSPKPTRGAADYATAAAELAPYLFPDEPRHDAPGLTTTSETAPLPVPPRPGVSPRPTPTPQEVASSGPQDGSNGVSPSSPAPSAPTAVEPAAEGPERVQPPSEEAKSRWVPIPPSGDLT